MGLPQFYAGLFANLPAIRDEEALYFCTDTHQIFKGSAEYTKGTKVLSGVPDTSTVGDVGRLGAYNGNLYLCTAADSGSYTWIRVANVNDEGGTVTSIGFGEGLTGADGTTNPITTTGTIQHAIPSGASTVADALVDQTPTFGGTFNIVGVDTDKFGHVTGVNTHTVTIPAETALTVESATGTPVTLSAGSTFSAITEVEEGAADQSVKKTATVFTLPSDIDTTYDISSTTEGVITLTPSTGNATTVQINGWDDLAKKSELAAVLTFKGVVATVNDLPDEAEVGWVYNVVTTPSGSSAEYVCTTKGTGSADPAVWEELGTTLDLSAYATTGSVIQRVTGEDGEVPKFKADGTLESTGFTLGTSVPSTAVFTDTTYENATTAVAGLMSTTDKAKLDGIESGAQVNTVLGVKGAAESSYRTGMIDIDLADLGVNATTAELNLLNGNIADVSGTVTLTGDITGNAATATSATSATQDGAGNVITDTYATTASLAWKSFTA